MNLKNFPNLQEKVTSEEVLAWLAKLFSICEFPPPPPPPPTGLLLLLSRRRHWASSSPGIIIHCIRTIDQTDLDLSIDSNHQSLSFAPFCFPPIVLNKFKHLWFEWHPYWHIRDIFANRGASDAHRHLPPLQGGFSSRASLWDLWNRFKCKPSWDAFSNGFTKLSPIHLVYLVFPNPQ